MERNGENGKPGGPVGKDGIASPSAPFGTAASQATGALGEEPGTASPERPADDTMTGVEPGPAFMPGEPIPPAATGIPIVEGAAADREDTSSLGDITSEGPRTDHPRVDVAPLHHGTAASPVQPPTVAEQTHSHSVQEVAHEVEEELERRAAVGFLGGPIVWGLLALIVVVVLIYLAS